MNDETEVMVTAMVESINKGLISLPRAKRQLEQWSTAGKTIERVPVRTDGKRSEIEFTEDQLRDLHAFLGGMFAKWKP